METGAARPEIPPWTNQEITLYHGTTERGADSISKDGVLLTRCRSQAVDFGRGFYLTTSREQAVTWAQKKVVTSNRPWANVGGPRLCVFSVSRDSVAGLSSLWFVRSTRDAIDYWSFVRFCRSRTWSGLLHGRGDWYDIVIGPVALGYAARLRAMEQSDQVSFHTERAIALLGQPTVVES